MCPLQYIIITLSLICHRLMDDNDAFEAKLEAEPEAGGGLEANTDYNEVEIDAEPRRLDINPDTVLAAGEQSLVQVQTCEQCLTILEAATKAFSGFI